ncbi:syntaxin-binding protein KNAG_0A02670 [Huiozyma naganishii CBS 8797]|uniref:Sec1-like protein n=1 Tax=Huiozyma naganishii (strain ATCC MYA-139 / BCRC 22969 / CBS 8797 / KCTC 17520 / NBRC 10181 / NCYC 3082 / Yp74L-3) TaxID=1071383 RepID=J7S3F1_HUIN7|nr:hypothetical protein KNAG_0A02670 [Kazachstania naganishii CBS 8797]CCK67956.1 hypothetical protein KNAG_0A02670 [Kazachstania naganishii CBS 8797]
MPSDTVHELVGKEVSLRDMQASAILKMLFLNKDTKTTNLEDTFSDQELLWKVLVLDARSTAIVSSVLRVNDLLRAGVTVHALIQQDRPALSDVPAVYFLSPTENNIGMLVQDIKDDKYAEYYVNFTSTLSRDLLESFAKQVSTTGKADRVKQVFDQYLDFVVTEPELFSLEIRNAYSQLNNVVATEETITTLCDQIAEGLFNTVMTSGSIPIIRAPKGGPAEMVAEKLGAQLRDYVINTKSASSSAAGGMPGVDSLERCVLILLDRNIDFASMFAHTWAYQCFLFDVFKLSRNTLTIQTASDTKTAGGEGEDSKGLVTKQYDIEPTDFFWLQNAYLPFTQATENLEAALNQYKAEALEITKKTGVTDLSDLDPNSGNDTVQIQDVVNKLPELTARKKILDAHFNILSTVITELGKKKLDTFFELEQDPNSSKMRTDFMNILNDKLTNNLDDKARTFIYLFLTSSNGLPKDFVQEVEQYFKSNDYDISALKYIYKLREYMQLSSMNLQNKSLEDGARKGGKPSTYSLSGLYNLTEGKLPGKVGNIISGIKNLLPEKKTIPITNVVEAIVDPTNSSQKNLETTDNYLYIDPKITRGSHTKKPKRQTYNKAIVFVVGGGNYLEYQNLQEWAHSQLHNPKKVVYGSTALATPAEFLHEMATLGSEQK